MTRNGSIVGRVLDAAGAPLAGIAVSLTESPAGHREVAAITALDGTFRFGLLAPGQYRVEATGQSLRASARALVAPGAQANVEIRAGEGGEPRALGATMPDPNQPVRNDAGTSRQALVSEAYPWRCVCSLFIIARDGSAWRGTGWLAAPRLVVTAGQCVYMSGAGGWVASVEVSPGQSGNARPFGSVTSYDLRSVSGWVERGDPRHDYGAIILPDERGFGEGVGYLERASLADGALQSSALHLAAYSAAGIGPSDQSPRRGAPSALDPWRLTYALPAVAGEAGAPIWIERDDGRPCVVAIHTHGTSRSSSATRITAQLQNNIARWAQEAGRP